MVRWGQARTETERTCRGCGQTKPIREFASTGAYGRRSTCILCWNEAHRVAALPPEEAERRRARARERYRADPGRKIGQQREYLRRKRGPGVVAPRRWYTVIRASVELGCGENWVRTLCRRGQLCAVRVVGAAPGGTVWRIDPASVAEWKEQWEET